MSRALPYYKMYPGDAETDENFRLMTFEQRGFYWTALNHSWLNDGLPLEDAALMALFGIRGRKDFNRIESVLRTCFESDGSRLRNHRQEEERQKAITKSERATESVRTRYVRSTNDHLRASESGSVSESESSELGKEKPKVSIYGELEPLLAELEAIYTAAGRPIAPRQKQVCQQYLSEIPKDKWPMVPRFVLHSLATIWRDATKTKSLVNVLRDGDWDVPIVERTMPPPVNGSRPKSGLDVLNEMQAEERAKNA